MSSWASVVLTAFIFFVDLGSGLGKATLLTHLVSGATAVGQTTTSAP